MTPRPPVVRPGHTYASVTEKISAVVLSGRMPRSWTAGAAAGLALVLLFFYAVGLLFSAGIGIWGVNVPVSWGFAIVNFVWWIGIGHAGTLISAILLLMRQSWRTSINRFAEAMTLFAVACAAVYPLLHLGRPKFWYWLFPYPNTMGLWPQFRSPLVWDVFAVFTYGLTSLLFWYMGLIPDLATMRDRARGRFARAVYGFLAMGWRGAARHWLRYETAYVLLAGLATPLVVSVHTVVSFDFAISILPGWHSTVFPPYFVAGAIFSGFAMVVTLAVPLRKAYGLEDFITECHLDNMGKVMLATGLVVAYGYLMETFFSWYGGSRYEAAMMADRLGGAYAPAYWGTLACNVLATQALWFRAVRRRPLPLFGAALVINVGMWLERYVIVVQSLHRDYLPSAWHMYYPTVWDWATFAGTIGLFLTLFHLFVRLLPSISMFELRALVPPAPGEARG
ncbi:MAG TPA: NrfD/PsrC family molybdoenzyme membrane anchor subunit [Planctomycetota bacterium]|nr:NrfD/PsrC family molybdoenzyme membrane anchor subunit [Planctomycetota bacterium]